MIDLHVAKSGMIGFCAAISLLGFRTPRFEYRGMMNKQQKLYIQKGEI